jgi:hypothetical protein
VFVLPVRKAISSASAVRSIGQVSPRMKNLTHQVACASRIISSI